MYMMNRGMASLVFEAQTNFTVLTVTSSKLE